MVNIDQQKIKEILERGVEEVIEEESLRQKLQSGRKLRVKFGIDPTAPDLHLGHAVPLRKLRQFQDLGHKVILLIGDFTATIGDPSGKSSTRPILTEKEVKKNMKDYLKQADQILNIKKIEVRYNGEWFSKMKVKDFYELAGLESVFALMERSMFRERQEKKELLTLKEFTYPLLQAYDSYMLKADVEIGGIDQLFNVLHGRKIQEKLNQIPQEVMGLTLLVGLDGVNKMSKSLGNQIAFTDSSSEKFGKIMSIKDELIDQYFDLCTDFEQSKITQILETQNPRDQKALLAKEIVTMYHGEKEAQKAEEEFNKTFRDKNPDFQKFKYNEQEISILQLLVDLGLAPSKNEAKRLILQKAVKINGQVQEDWQKIIKTTTGTKIQVGPRKFLEII